MEVGLFFGSFNPVHTGHLLIAWYMAQYTSLEQVWLVVSPHNPLKTKTDLISVYDRLEMAKLATEDTTYLQVSDIELSLPQPSYTIDTLAYLHEKYPQHQFSIIMGGDNLVSLKKWKNYEQILANYRIYVYPRPEADTSEWLNHPSIVFTDTPAVEISASFIRKAITDKKPIDFWVHDKVKTFIDAKGLYKKK